MVYRGSTRLKFLATAITLTYKYVLSKSYFSFYWILIHILIPLSQVFGHNLVLGWCLARNCCSSCSVPEVLT